MNVRARKITRDLSSNPARTLLVVLGIAIGLAGLSTTLRARAIFTENLSATLAAVNISSATLATSGADDQIVATLVERDDISAAEGELVTLGRIRVGDGFRPLRLVVVNDPASMKVDRLRPEAGSWPLPDGDLALERSSIDATGLSIGDSVTVTDVFGGTHDLRVEATVYDATIVSGRLVDQVIFGYMSSATWQSLGLPAGFNQIAFTVTDGRQDEDHISDVARRARDQIIKAGFPVTGTTIPPPGRHVLDNVISSLLLILGALGVLALVLSGFLVVNTVTAMMVRQKRQIGVIKAVGGSRGDITVVYISTVAVYGLLALVVGIPIGAVAARSVTRQMGTLLNIDINRLVVPAWVWLAEIAVGLVVPILAALGPILSGTKATVAETIRDAGESTAFGEASIDRWLARRQRMPSSLRYAARNTFRQKARLLLTVVALALGGSILITVLSLRSSLVASVDSIADYWRQDVTIDLGEPTSFDELQTVIRSNAGVTGLEGWLTMPSSVVRPDGHDAGEETVVFGVPPGSAFIQPTLIEGRWLEPGDRNVVVVNVDVAANEPGTAQGDALTLRVGGLETIWDVVGVSTTQLVAPGQPRPSTPIAYVPYQSLAAALGIPGTTNRLVVAGVTHDANAQSVLADELDADLTAAGVGVQAVSTRSGMRSQVERLTNPILYLLAAMAALFALVGGLGLLSTMTLNVLERSKEFGVVRAVGATGRTVLSIVLVEGLSVAFLSWLLGSVLAVPLGWAMDNAVGVRFIKVPLQYRFAPLGVLAWLAIAMLVAIVASWVPARHASRLSVREAIAYE